MDKKTIGIYIGWFFEPWDEHTVASGMGGSETWAIELGKQFAKFGYNVIMYAHPEHDHIVVPGFDLVSTTRYDYDRIHRKFDYFIYSRNTNDIDYDLMCDNVYVMVHDVDMITTEYPTDRTNKSIGIGKVKKYCYLSEWHKENILKNNSHLDINESMLYKVSNGYSSEYYTDTNILQKEDYFVWSSSLERGFEVFYMYVFFPLLQEFPHLKLYVSCGTLVQKDLSMLRRAALLPGVEVKGKLSKKELAELQKGSKIWIYPGLFPETFCITAVECCAAGNVIVSPLSYGLKTTIGSLDYLQKFNLPLLYTEEDGKKYVDIVRNILTDENYRLHLAANSLALAKNFSWEKTAIEFINLFNEA